MYLIAWMLIGNQGFHAPLLHLSSGRERKIFEKSKKTKNSRANIYVEICMTLFLCVCVLVCELNLRITVCGRIGDC